MTDIIPKPAVKVALWLNVLFYGSILLAVLSVAAVFASNALQNNLLFSISSLETAIDQGQAKITPLESEILFKQFQINDFSLISLDRKKSQNIFPFLEENIHPKAQFTSFSLDLSGLRVGLSGRAESFIVLGQQIIAFKNQPNVEKIGLSRASIAPGGGVLFELNLTLSPKLFK